MLIGNKNFKRTYSGLNGKLLWSENSRINLNFIRLGIGRYVFLFVSAKGNFISHHFNIFKEYEKSVGT